MSTAIPILNNVVVGNYSIDTACSGATVPATSFMMTLPAKISTFLAYEFRNIF
jgi:hypothetical protein